MDKVVQQQMRESNISDQENHEVAASGKLRRYTPEQLEVLERYFTECAYPTSLRMQQFIRECPVLVNVEFKQIKAWFQNRRCKEKRVKEMPLQTVNGKLVAINKHLKEENDRLLKLVSRLKSENGIMRQQQDIVNASGPTGASCDSAVNAPHQSVRDENTVVGLKLIAEENLAEFLSKAKGTADGWVQMAGMKPASDSVGMLAILENCNGVAAGACGFVRLEPTKIAEILKDRPSWFRDCRSLETFATFPAGNGGTIDILYMQTYAPTTLALARDFWTLRYTTTLENGSLVVCESSLSGSGVGPNAATASQFTRAEMLPSGYLIQPCKGGGSIIHIVDHLNLEAWTGPEVLRPLYESSRIVAQRMTIPALRYIRQIAQESSGEVEYDLRRQPAVIRTFGHKLSRGFNDAINGFNDDGWSTLNNDSIVDDIILAVNSTKILTSNSNQSYSFPSIGGIICAKASILLQNVSPAVFIRYLREDRSEWANFSSEAYFASFFKAAPHAYSRIRATSFSGNQIIKPLGQAIGIEERLEVIRLEIHPLAEDYGSRNINLLQMCSGIDENAVGACSELIFSHIAGKFADDAPLLPCGFRIVPLEAKTDMAATNRTLDLTSGIGVDSSVNSVGGDGLSSNNARSVLTIAYQFPFQSSLHGDVAIVARKYVQSIIASVRRLEMIIDPLVSTPSVRPKPSISSSDFLTLARWIYQSFSLHVELVKSDPMDYQLKSLWTHQNAILCCSLKLSPAFIFANEAGLVMLETTLAGLKGIDLDRIFDDSEKKALFEDNGKLMEQGYVYLPGGTCMSIMGRSVSYQQAIAWKVHAGVENTADYLAVSFVNWSFV